MEQAVNKLEKLAKALENDIKKNNLQRLGYSHISCKSCRNTVKNIFEFISKWRNEKNKNDNT